MNVEEIPHAASLDPISENGREWFPIDSQGPKSLPLIERGVNRREQDDPRGTDRSPDLRRGPVATTPLQPILPGQVNQAADHLINRLLSQCCDFSTMWIPSKGKATPKCGISVASEEKSHLRAVCVL
jgi:hypothetical protein